MVVAGSLALIAAARTLALPELYVLAGAGLVLVATALAVVSTPAPVLDVERSISPRRVHLGDASRVELSVTNRSGRRFPLVSIHDPVEGTAGAELRLAPLPPGDRRRAGYRLLTRRRGLVRVGPLVATRTDPFGLATRSITLAEPLELTVLPVVEPLHGGMAGSGADMATSGPARPRAGMVGGDEFASLREYVVGDDLRRIHWASSARTGDLMVRQDDSAWQGQLTIVLEARTERIDAASFETAVSAAASLVNAAAERGLRVRLLVTDGSDSGPTDARAALDMLLEHLAVVDRHGGGELPALRVSTRPDTGDVVLVTGSPAGDGWAELGLLHRPGSTTRVVAVGGATPPTGSSPSPSPEVEVTLIEPGRPVAAALSTMWAGSSRWSRARRTGSGG